MSSITSKIDLAWDYFEVDPNDRNTTTCKFCHKVTKGGIFWVKQHLVGGFRNTKVCPKYPPSVKQEIGEYMQKKKNYRDKQNMALLDDDFQFGEGYDDDNELPPQSRKDLIYLPKVEAVLVVLVVLKGQHKRVHLMFFLKTQKLMC